MRAPRARSVITAALVGLLGPICLGAAPLDIVRDCAANTPAQVSGVKNLNAVCPRLEDALQALGLDRMLYDGWRERLNRDSLRDVARLADSYGRSMSAAPPEVSALKGVLESLAREQTPMPKSWWDAFRAWLDSWLKSHDVDSLSWLDRWLERIRQSAALLNAILYSLIGMVLIAAAWVVVNELKAAGLIGSERNKTAAAALDANERGGGARAAEPTAPADRLSGLLALLVKRLVQAGRLTGERSLTHRELVFRSAFDGESQRAVFAEVAQGAESSLYGAQSGSPEHLDSVLQRGEALLAQLSNSSSAH